MVLRFSNSKRAALSISPTSLCVGLSFLTIVISGSSVLRTVGQGQKSFPPVSSCLWTSRPTLRPRAA